MIKSRHTTAICIAVTVAMVVVTILFAAGQSLGIEAVSVNMPYVEKLFSTDAVHTLDIVADDDDWQELLDNAINEEYIACDVVIDGDHVGNVGIRAKGNTSLSSIVSSDSDRYSFKLEFDHYNSVQSYYGLDKLALNNIAQDNTYLKDYLSYRMMNAFGADSPLCSFIYITINGEDWGLYLAVEAVEDSFINRTYGNSGGQLYKPDSMSMNGGGIGGGNNAQQTPPQAGIPSSDEDSSGGNNSGENAEGAMPEGFENMQPPEFAQDGEMPPLGEGEMPGDGSEMPSAGQEAPATGDNEQSQDGGMGGMGGSNDVALIYTDDEYDSYSNIFDNAKTNPADEDKDRLIASIKQLNEGENLEEVVNIEEVLRYFVVHNFVLNFDSYTGSLMHNYYLYEENGQLSMIAWDYNLAFGAFSGGGMGGSSSDSATTLVNYPIDTPVSGATLENRPMLGQLLSDETYLAQYHMLFSEFIVQMFDTSSFTDLIDNAIELISPYVEKDPTAFCSYEDFLTASSTLREFCLLRAESITGQLDGTIPATSDGQAEDGSALIDASGIDMQIMGNNASSFGFGGGR